MLSREDRIELQRLRCDHAALCFQVALIKYGLQLRYDDNQPRVPAGHVGAGRWTSDAAHETSRAARRDAQQDAEPPASPPPQQDEWRITHVNHRPDGSIERQIVVTPDGDTISSVFARPGEQRFDERHRVQLADGTVRIFETTQGVQKIYDGDGALLSATRWTDKGPEAVEMVQQAYKPPIGPAPLATLNAAHALYTFLSTRNGPDRQALLAYPPRLYENIKGQEEPLFVGFVKPEDIRRSCERLKDVQRFTDDAVGKIKRSDFETAAAYGTAIHLYVKEKIKAEKDDNFRYEISILKTLDETKELPRLAEYGEKGSIRLDALQHIRAQQTACVMDVKTLQARLRLARSSEIAGAAAKNFGYVRWIFVIEVKPTVK